MFNKANKKTIKQTNTYTRSMNYIEVDTNKYIISGRDDVVHRCFGSEAEAFCYKL